MQKNVASQKWVVFAFDETDNTPKTGLADITANLRIDGGAANAVDDTNPTELEDGYYVFDITAAESNGDSIVICPESATADIQVIGVPGAVWTRPPNFEALGIESDGDIIKVNTLGATALDLIASTATGMVEIAKAVWDRLLTGATHNIVNSSGRIIRNLRDYEGYANGAIWIDTVNGTAGTGDYENGTVTNPVDSIADANTLAASLGIGRFRVAPGSSITFAATQADQEFIGTGWTLALGGQSISGSYVRGATVSGIGTGINPASFEMCEMGTCTLAPHNLSDCKVSGDITLGSNGDIHWHDCKSAVAGTATPTLDTGAAIANSNINIRGYLGGLEVANLGASGTDTMSFDCPAGQLILAASCVAGNIRRAGLNRLTNNGSGMSITDGYGMTINTDINGDPTAALEAYRLNELFSVALGSQPAAGSLLGDLTEDDAGTQRFNANALELAPTGGGGGLTAQETADAVYNLAPGSTPAAGSAGKRLEDIDTETASLVGWRTNMGYAVGGRDLMLADGWANTSTVACDNLPTGNASWKIDAYFNDPNGAGWSILYDQDMFDIVAGGPSAAEWTGSLTADVIRVQAIPGTGTLPACTLTFTTSRGVMQWDLPETTAGAFWYLGVNGELRGKNYGGIQAGTPAAARGNRDILTDATFGLEALDTDLGTLLTRATEGRLAELDPANLPADVDTLLTRATEVRLAELDAANLPADVDGLTAAVAALPAVADIWSHVIDGTVTAEEVLVASLAFSAGETSGGDTATVTFKRQDGATAAITMSVDADGNRSSVVTLLS